MREFKAIGGKLVFLLGRIKKKREMHSHAKKNDSVCLMCERERERAEA